MTMNRLEGLARQGLPPEVVLPPLSPETQRLVEHMQNNGYAVYETAGKTPISLKQEGMCYLRLNPALENVTASPSLLAFKVAPSEFFLAGSKDIPHEEQLKFLPEEQTRVDKQYPSEGLIVREGKLPEWPELALRHFKETSRTGRGVRIFGKDYKRAYTWTDTYESDQPGAGRAAVGRWRWVLGLDVLLGHPDRVHPVLGLAPLVEIPRK